MSQTHRKWLAIDTDAGVDDAVALCLAMQLAESYGYEVKMISCVQGNCSLDQVAINVAKCREACRGVGNPEPKICIGSDKSLKGTQVDATFFHGNDGLGDVTDGSISNPTAIHTNDCAIDELVNLANEAKSIEDVHLTIIALGPLTNIAKAMMKSASFSSSVDELLLMGGCGNARGNITRVAEFNIYNDPEAAQYVFINWTRKEITVASWEYTVQHPLPWHDFDSILGINNPNHNEVGNFLSKILHKSYGNHENCEERKSSSARPIEGAVICDPCAMIYFLDRRTAKSCEYVHVEVECESELTRGMTVVDWGCYDGSNRTRNVKWLKQMDVNLYADILRQACLNNI